MPRWRGVHRPHLGRGGVSGDEPAEAVADPRVPPGVDTSQASIARVYDYLLGGVHHFAVDRAAARELERSWPDAAEAMRAQRAFLRRAVRFLAGQGIDQFLDVGSGIPTAGNVHEIAQRVNPHARVVYADIDRVPVAHARQILREQRADHVGVILGDVRRPDRILADPDVLRLIDLSRPVAVLLCYVQVILGSRLLAHGIAPGQRRTRLTDAA